MSTSPVVTTADGSNFPTPPGTKLTLDSNSQSFKSYPVVRWTSYTYWPLSYYDNRFSFAIVVTDASGNIMRIVEAIGARYIREIRLDPAGQKVNFVGQIGQNATVPYSTLFVAMTAASSISTSTTTIPQNIATSISSIRISTFSTSTLSASSKLSSSSLSTSHSAAPGPNKLSVGAEIGSIIGGIFGVIAVIVAIFGIKIRRGR